MHLERREFLRAGLVGSAAIPWMGLAAGKHAVADTDSGKVRGVEVGGVKIFKGIPYGANTGGLNRFMPPALPKKWSGVRDALDYGPKAPQSDPGVGNGLAGESEDCLVLNVWTPDLKDGKKRPVMFWCHGGGFYAGSGASSATDGTNLARSGDVVVVTINHRLNVLGFTHLEEFGGAAFAESGDVGMLDIVQALKWVRTNIAEFGGDAGNVTIFGQSGGGRKVQTLLAMPAAKGLFHRGIIQSGASIRLVEPDQATRVAAELMKQLGLERTRLRELQKLPLERIMSAYFAANKALNVDPMTMGFAPVVNGRSIPTHPFHPVASPVSADVPVMTGSTRTEWTSQADKAAFSLDDAGMRGRIEKLVGSQAGDVIALYRRLNPKATASQVYFLISSDHRYTGPTLKVAERRAALGRGPVYLYYFCWETPVDGGRYGSPHGIEVPLAFANPDGSRMTASVPGAAEMADRVSSAWLAFARTGNPNGGKLPDWPVFDGQRRATMVFNSQSRVIDDPIREQREAMFRAWGYS